MIISNFCAVNEASVFSTESSSSSACGGSGSGSAVVPIKELEEERYVGSYNSALGLFGSGDFKEALEGFKEIYSSDYLNYYGSKGTKPYPMALNLEKCSSKYLGLSYHKLKDWKNALKYFCVSIDVKDDDVSLHFKAALTAIKLQHLHLAKSFLETGLDISENHWPSIELLIIINFKMKDYYGSLKMIHKALSIDPSYKKAIEIRDKIVLENKYYGIDLGIPLSSDPPKNFEITRGWSYSVPSIRKVPNKLKIFLSPTSFVSLSSTFIEEYPKNDITLRMELIEKTPSSLISVSVRSLLDEIVDSVVSNKMTDSMIISGSILDEVLEEIPPYTSEALVQDILKQVLTEVVSVGSSDFLANLQATEIRRSSRARVPNNSCDKSSVIADNSVRFKLESFIPTEYLMPPKVVEEKVEIQEDLESKTLLKRLKLLSGETEEMLARDFFQSIQSNNEGILDSILFLLKRLEDLSGLYSWTEELSDSFLALYFTWRFHFVFPDFPSELTIYFKIMILANEIILDRFGSRNSPEDLKYLSSDIKYMEENSCNIPILWKIRILSIMLKHCILDKNDYEILRYGGLLKDLYDEIEDPPILPLNNYQVLTPPMIDKALEVIKRTALVDKLYNLFEEQKYGIIVDVLNQALSIEPAEREYQLGILVDSYWHLEDYRNTLKWTAIALSDYAESKKEETIDYSWTTGTLDYLTTIECALIHCDFDVLQPHLKARLTQALLQIVVVQVEYYSKQFVTNSLLPWIFLFKLIKLAKLETKPEVSFLIAAHNYLGPHSLCMQSKGSLLLLIIQEIISTEESFRRKALEQAIYCLYSHPSKKSRFKHLVDHGVSQIDLDFHSGILLYNRYFKPSSMPEFDDFKSNSISADTEIFLKRLIPLLPSEPLDRRSLLKRFILENETQSIEKKLSKKVLPESLRDYYYLLADFHFKNSDFKTATSFYLLDLSYNIRRKDSWIALSLAHANEVEGMITDLKGPRNHKDILAEAAFSLRCFSNAILYAQSGTTVYIEHANFNYVLRSYTSRTLNALPENISMDTFKKIEDMKEKSLNRARENYLKALSIAESPASEYDDERWLLYFMQGKILRKLREPLKDVLECFVKSFDHLISLGASIPKKISYNAPPTYSLELLELFYRIHASVLKSPEQDSVVGLKNILISVRDKLPFAENKKNPNITVEPIVPTGEETIVNLCVNGIETVVKYFPQHFRALYTLAFYYFKKRDLPDKAKIYLLGDVAGNKTSAALFSDRKPSNLFNGIWRSPLSELDRAGSFSVHVSKATTLLLEVLQKCKDYHVLAEVTAMLKRPPPGGERTYLSDSDRINFARISQSYYSSAVASVVEDAKANACKETAKQGLRTLLDVQQVYAKTRKTFREDSVRGMLIELSTALGVPCKTYEEVNNFCQKINSEDKQMTGNKKNVTSPAVKLKTAKIVTPKLNIPPGLLNNQSIPIIPHIKSVGKIPSCPKPAKMPKLGLSSSKLFPAMDPSMVPGLSPKTFSPTLNRALPKEPIKQNIVPKEVIKNTPSTKQPTISVRSVESLNSMSHLKSTSMVRNLPNVTITKTSPKLPTLPSGVSILNKGIVTPKILQAASLPGSSSVKTQSSLNKSQSISIKPAVKKSTAKKMSNAPSGSTKGSNPLKGVTKGTPTDKLSAATINALLNTVKASTSNSTNKPSSDDIDVICID